MALLVCHRHASIHLIEVEGKYVAKQDGGQEGNCKFLDYCLRKIVGTEIG